MNGLKSLAWVAPLTLVIWIWAEREQLVTMTNQQLTIQARSTDPTRVVRFVDLMTGQPSLRTIVHADLKGPQGAIDKVRDSIEATGSAVEIEVDHNIPDGIHPISISELINNAARFKANGVSVSNVMPHELTVRVDPVKEMLVRVTPPPSVTNLTAPPVFTPAEVRVSGPRSVLDDAQRDGRLQVFAQLDRFRELSQPGHKTLSSVPLKVSLPDPDVHVLTAVVSAEVDVREKDIQGTIPYVRLLAAYPLIGASRQFEAVPSTPAPTLPNVPVVGPKEIIDQLVKDKYEPRPTATFEVNLNDTANPDAERSATLKYELPEGVHLAPGAPRDIKYHLESRNKVDQ